MKNNQFLQGHCRHSKVRICELCRLEIEIFQEFEQLNASHQKQRQAEGFKASAEPEAIAEIRLTEILLFSRFEFFGLGSNRTLKKGKAGVIDLTETNAVFLDEADPYHAMIFLLLAKEKKGASVGLQSRGRRGVLVDGELFLPPWADNLIDGESFKIGGNEFRLRMTPAHYRDCFPGREWVASLEVFEMVNRPILKLEGRGNEIFREGEKSGVFRDEIAVGFPKRIDDPPPDWILPSPLVSWNHCSLYFQDGEFYIRNGWFSQPCRNVTYFRVPSMTPGVDAEPLRDGESRKIGRSERGIAEIIIGPFKFEFRYRSFE